MNKQEKTDIFNNYKFLIQKIVHSFYITNPGIDYKELLSEGYLGFLNSIDGYSQEKGKISTFIYSSVKNHLISYCKEWYNKNKNTYTDKMDCFGTEQSDNYLDILERSDDAILSTIAVVIKHAKKTNKHHRKYGWLDKKVHLITGEKYETIWDTFKKAESIIKG